MDENERSYTPIDATRDVYRTAQSAKNIGDKINQYQNTKNNGPQMPKSGKNVNNQGNNQNESLKGQKGANSKPQGHATKTGANRNADMGPGINNAAKTAGTNAGKNANRIKQAAVVAKNAGKAAEIAGGTAAGAATGGLGFIPMIIKAAADAAKNVATVTDPNNDNAHKNIVVIFGFLIAGLFFITVICGTALFNIIPGQNENYQEVEYGNQPDTIAAESNYTFTRQRTKKGGAVKTETDYAQPLKEGSLEYKNATDEAIKAAFTDYAMLMVESLDTRFKDRIKDLWNSVWGEPVYDREYTKESFYNNPYPYNLMIDSDHYTIGDYIHSVNPDFEDSDGFDLSNCLTIPTEQINNDINYAEILSVFTENKAFSNKNCSLANYKEFLAYEKTKQLFYEMAVNGPYYYTTVEWTDTSVTPAKTYSVIIGKGDESIMRADDERLQKVTIDGHEYERSTDIYYYFKIKVKPYGLRELYEMMTDCDVTLPDPDADGNAVKIENVDPYANHKDFKTFTNLDMVDKHEYYMRTYTREDQNKDGVVDDSENILGPSYDRRRSEQSTIYNDLMSIGAVGKDGYPTGRSAWSYISDADTISYEEWMKEYNKATPEEKDPSKGEEIVLQVVDDADIQKDIADGLYTMEDYRYLYAVMCSEAGSNSNGDVAVGSCILNRLHSGKFGGSIKAIVSARGQFVSPWSSYLNVKSFSNSNAKAAARGILRGSIESNIGDYCFFFGRCSGYDLWYSPSGGPTPVNIGGNVFHAGGGYVHNKQNSKTDDAVTIWDHVSGKWYL